MLPNQNPAQAQAQARIEWFEQENGKPVDGGGTWLYYATGARREYERYGFGQMEPPPEDDRERYANICQYHRLAVKRQTQAFDDLKESLTHNPGTHPDPADNIARLTAARDAVRASNKALAAAEVALEDADLAARGMTRADAAEQAKAEAKRAAAEEAYKTELSNIKV
ncbi:hypothetical protein FF011L_06160 [Roseimaritima multifibrata]|uniref:Uncharacterized protein n=1 Tax=Roseimaritima multifibrata TaxID=1930274 RepID=A0A517MAF9_9BACT|nr:hypothetical protein [Roseimaritima multifibrata]QDS91880.1 hypothetical protein FF011L_06160 [Roseimaritima multifibrata]